jgi:hypothetical protein
VGLCQAASHTTGACLIPRESTGDARLRASRQTPFLLQPNHDALRGNTPASPTVSGKWCHPWSHCGCCWLCWHASTAQLSQRFHWQADFITRSTVTFPCSPRCAGPGGVAADAGQTPQDSSGSTSRRRRGVMRIDQGVPSAFPPWIRRTPSSTKEPDVMLAEWLPTCSTSVDAVCKTGKGPQGSITCAAHEEYPRIMGLRLPGDGVTPSVLPGYLPYKT